MTLPRLYTDENVPVALAAALRDRGFDAACARDAGLLKASDLRHLERAVAEGRTVLTFDLTDFPRTAQAFVAAGHDHWGVVLAAQRAYPEFASLLRSVAHLLRSTERDELLNQIVFLSRVD